MTGTADHVLRNREYWNRQAARHVSGGRRNWASRPSWGVWRIPDLELGGFLTEVDGLDTLELGCGTAYISSWMQRRGACAVGLDSSPAQVATARLLQNENDLHFPLIQADAEHIPLREAAFDLVVSEYGASTWCDPGAWVPEAARLLRPGGRLVHLVTGTLFALCAPDQWSSPAGNTLLRAYFSRHRVEDPGDLSVMYHLGYGEWIRLLRRSGFEVEDLIEIRPPEGMQSPVGYMTNEWARRWPTEDIWVARRR